MTQHQLYLQLRRDLLEDRIRCTEQQAMALAALAMQVEFDDYAISHKMRNYFATEHYIPPRTLRKTGQFSVLWMFYEID